MTTKHDAEKVGKVANGVTYGGIDKKGLPIWYLRLRFRLPSGEKVSRTLPPIHGGTRLAAERRVVQAQHEVMQQGVADQRTLSVARLLEGWLNSRRAQRRPAGTARSGRQDRSLSPKTIRTNEEVVTMHILPELGQHRVAALTADTLEDFYKRLAQKAPSRLLHQQGLHTTVERAHTVFKQALAWAVRKQWVAHNVAAQADAPRVIGVRRAERQAAGVPDYWTTEQIASLTDACLMNGGAHALALAFALHTGLRIGETYGLQWGDITAPDADGQVFMHVQRGADIYGNLGSLKTARSNRRVKLFPEAVAVLEAVRAWQTRQARRPAWVPPEDAAHLAVFSTIDGKTNYSTNARNIRLKLCKQAGVPVLPFHSARHSFIHEQAFVAGQSLQKVSRYVGHASIDVTDRHYGFWTDTNDLD